MVPKLWYPNGPFEFQKLGVLIVSHTSFAAQSGSKSQQGHLHFFASAELLLARKNCNFDVCTDCIIFQYCHEEGMPCNPTRGDLCYRTRRRPVQRATGFVLQSKTMHGIGSTFAGQSHMVLSDGRSLATYGYKIKLKAISQSLLADTGSQSTEITRGWGDRAGWCAAAKRPLTSHNATKLDVPVSVLFFWHW